MPDPILPGRAGLYLSMLHYAFADNRKFAREHVEFFKRLETDVGPLRGLRVLDVGCGKTYWLSLLLAAAGADVVGIDTELVETKRGFGKFAHIRKRNGVDRALRTAVWDLLFARGYYRELQRCMQRPLPHENLQLRVYDGVHVDFPDASFDLVVSHEVFEHIADVRSVLAEIARVLRPGGRTYIYIHNFTSLSGGHHIAWKAPDSQPSRVVPPWDHLRARRYCDIPSWLNGLREHEYQQLFAEYFQVEEWRHTAIEGTALLSAEIRAELARFSEQELLTKGFLVRARPLSASERNLRRAVAGGN